MVNINAKVNTSLKMIILLVFCQTIRTQMDIFLASKVGYLEYVKFAVGCGVSVNEKDGYGETPLLIASDHGHIDIVKFLVECGANVNERTCYNWTPLIFMIRRGRLDVVKFLVEHGANVIEKDSNGKDALSFTQSDVIREYLKQAQQFQQAPQRVKACR